jgi:hypothetical protein
MQCFCTIQIWKTVNLKLLYKLTITIFSRISGMASPKEQFVQFQRKYFILSIIAVQYLYQKLKILPSKIYNFGY